MDGVYDELHTYIYIEVSIIYREQYTERERAGTKKEKEEKKLQSSCGMHQHKCDEACVVVLKKPYICILIAYNNPYIYIPFHSISYYTTPTNPPFCYKMPKSLYRDLASLYEEYLHEQQGPR